MKEQLTTMTRKGQITVPADIRRALDLHIGDKVAVSLEEEDGALHATLRPVRSVAEMTFGIITPRKRPEDMKGLREIAIDEIAENAASEGRTAGHEEG
jgi:AbrB family looped-hinge helix DNA binding protein